MIFSYLKYIDQLELHLWVNLQCGIIHVIVLVKTIIKCKKKERQVKPLKLLNAAAQQGLRNVKEIDHTAFVYVHT